MNNTNSTSTSVTSQRPSDTNRSVDDAFVIRLQRLYSEFKRFLLTIDKDHVTAQDRLCLELLMQKIHAPQQLDSASRATTILREPVESFELRCANSACDLPLPIFLPLAEFSSNVQDMLHHLEEMPCIDCRIHSYGVDLAAWQQCDHDFSAGEPMTMCDVESCKAIDAELATLDEQHEAGEDFSTTWRKLHDACRPEAPLENAKIRLESADIDWSDSGSASPVHSQGSKATTDPEDSVPNNLLGVRSFTIPSDCTIRDITDAALSFTGFDIFEKFQFVFVFLEALPMRGLRARAYKDSIMLHNKQGSAIFCPRPPVDDEEATRSLRVIVDKHQAGDRSTIEAYQAGDGRISTENLKLPKLPDLAEWVREKMDKHYKDMSVNLSLQAPPNVPTTEHNSAPTHTPPGDPIEIGRPTSEPQSILKTPSQGLIEHDSTRDLSRQSSEDTPIEAAITEVPKPRASPPATDATTLQTETSSGAQVEEPQPTNITAEVEGTMFQDGEESEEDEQEDEGMSPEEKHRAQHKRVLKRLRDRGLAGLTSKREARDDVTAVEDASAPSTAALGNLKESPESKKARK